MHTQTCAHTHIKGIYTHGLTVLTHKDHRLTKPPVPGTKIFLFECLVRVDPVTLK